MAIAPPPRSSSPPHNLEAEESVLGAILLVDAALYELVIHEGLKAEDFYLDRHRLTYEAMLDINSKGDSIDPLTVVDQLRQTGKLEQVGGEAFVDALAGAVPVAGNVRQYAQIVRENALLRRLMTATFEIQAAVAGRDGTPRDLVELAERTMLEVAHDDRQKDFQSIETVLDVELHRLQELARGGGSVTGTPSGFTDLDAITGGFQPGNLIILAARPSMGKSALVTNIAENVALQTGKAVALFSLEMSESELAHRFVASQAKIKGEELRKGRVAETKWPTILAASQRLGDSRLFVDDSSDVSMLEIRAKARRLYAREKELGLIIVDYLQLIRADGRIENRVEQVGQMSRGLKILARELECPVIALSQLNRGVEARTDKRPMLSDLRESGQIEQDADLVMFIFRDDYYDKESERVGEADIIIAKHRNGATGELTLTFQKEYPRFMNYVGGDRFS
jgi:replicative DNA helicase